MRTYVYVDGFNLFYGILKKSPYKWLNLKKLCQNILREEYSIESINYYTARVSDTINPGSSKRQQIYINALQTIPELKVHYGNFIFHEKYLRKVERPKDSKKGNFHKAPELLTKEYALVLHPEEKGSDVKLATHLLNDAWNNRYDAAIVITNDTDLVEPMKLVLRERKKQVIVVNPTKNKVAGSIRKIKPTFVTQLSSKRLKEAQFPDNIPSTDITKPNEW